MFFVFVFYSRLLTVEDFCSGLVHSSHVSSTPIFLTVMLSSAIVTGRECFVCASLEFAHGDVLCDFHRE